MVHCAKQPAPLPLALLAIFLLSGFVIIEKFPF